MAVPFRMMKIPCGTCSLGTSLSQRVVLRRIIESPMNTIRGVLHAAGLGVLTCMFVCCAGACLGQSGESQQQAELKGLREDVSTLKNDVRILGQRLQQVMQKLDELTKPPRASLDT